MMEFAEEPTEQIEVFGKIYEKKKGAYSFDLIFKSKGMEQVWHSPRSFSNEVLASNVMNYIGECAIQIVQFRIGVIRGNLGEH